MLEFAKYLCIGSQFTFSCQDMSFFRQEIKEELVMNKIIKKNTRKFLNIPVLRQKMCQIKTNE
jgi:hypothetical protein